MSVLQGPTAVLAAMVGAETQLDPTRAFATLATDSSMDALVKVSAVACSYICHLFPHHRH
jgi:hypothetical protein